VDLQDELLPVVREAIADHPSELERPIHGLYPRVRASKIPVEETVDGVFRALQRALESPEHSAERRPRRMVAMASERESSRACGITDEAVEVEGIYYAAALFDSGKIGGARAGPRETTAAGGGRLGGAALPSGARLANPS
jgi:hypothetical protein